MKKVAVLGSTGSIGRQTLNIVENFPDEFEITLLAASKVSQTLLHQIEKFKPQYIYLPEKENIKGVKVLYGEEGLQELAKLEVDLFVNGISGIAGIKPTYLILQNNRQLATANKEAIICLGEVIAHKYSSILPIDSEHSAIFQALKTGKKEEVKKIILTASGGPFWNKDKLKNISVEDALNHPRWKMGKKVSIDSATMMNKGFEIIEAHYLFGIPYSKIEAVIHPQSIVHGIVEFVDGSFIAHMSNPDMRIPISYALFYPERKSLDIEKLNLIKASKLEFFEPNEEKFPLLKLAKECGEKKGAYPTVLTVADELAVNLFLEEKISFEEIPILIQEVIEKASFPSPKSYEDIIHIIDQTKILFKTLYKTVGGKV